MCLGRGGVVAAADAAAKEFAEAVDAGRALQKAQARRAVVAEEARATGWRMEEGASGWGWVVLFF